MRRSRKPVDVLFAYDIYFWDGDPSHDIQEGYENGKLVKSYTVVGAIIKRLWYSFLYDHIEDKK